MNYSIDDSYGAPNYITRGDGRERGGGNDREGMCDFLGDSPPCYPADIYWQWDENGDKGMGDDGGTG